MKEGYSLKKRLLKSWIYQNGYSQPYIAKKLGLGLDEFKRKLKHHDKFCKKQITILVHMMKAEQAFEVLYFDNSKTRRDVYYKVFGVNLMEKRRKVNES